MIEALRHEISAIDKEIFSLIKKREILSGKIGQAKRKLNIADRDFKREKAVFDSLIILAKDLGLPIDFVTHIQKQLIEFSLSRQEQDRIRNNFEDAPKSILIIGGSGRLGGWLCRFFTDSGHRVSVIDKQDPGFACNFKKNLDHSDQDHDVIIIATPIRISIKILEELADLELKKPLVFDVSSVKAPLAQALLKLKDQGVKVTSLHPMFGPSVGLLFGRHIIQTSLGVKDADLEAQNLFSSTSVQIVQMSMENHDEIIAYLLSLSHLLNIIFGQVLKNSSLSIKDLENFSSPTFSNQLAIARRVFLENPSLYFEIQALNPYNTKIYSEIKTVFNHLTDSILKNKENNFCQAMHDGFEFLTQEQL